MVLSENHEPRPGLGMVSVRSCLLLNFVVLCSSSTGHAARVDWAETVHRRRGLAREENLSLWGYGVLGSAWHGDRNLRCSAARLAHLLLLEEKQTVSESSNSSLFTFTLHFDVDVFIYFIFFPCIDSFACFPLQGWSTNTPAWLCLPIRSVKCRWPTAVPWWRERTRETWRMRLCTQNLHCLGNSKP